MSKRREDLYLVDIVDSCSEIARFTDGLEAEEWVADRLRRDAVLYKLTVIGEACRQVSEDLRKRHDGMPWRDIIGFRNVAVHEYFAVEWQVVWRIARRQVPGAVGLRSRHP